MTRFVTYHFSNDYHAGIGEMVDNDLINCFDEFIHWFGQESFNRIIFEGEAADVAYAYIYPCDEMRETKRFDEIQKAFFNAYV